MGVLHNYEFLFLCRFFIIFHILPYPDGRRVGELRGKREGSPRRGSLSCIILHTISLCSIQDLDKLIERIYEDQVLGNISAERYARMSVNYENEQRTLINKVAEDEKKLACIEQTSLDLKTLLKVLRSSTSFEELTPTLVNSLIRRIEVHNNDKSSGHCYVKVDIYFTAIGLIDIPTEDEIKSLMAKIKANPQEYRLTA